VIPKSIQNIIQGRDDTDCFCWLLANTQQHFQNLFILQISAVGVTWCVIGHLTTQMVKHELYAIWLFSWWLWGSTNTLAHIINCRSLQSCLMNTKTSNWDVMCS